MNAHAELVERFYAALAARDADGVAACYHPDVVFHDPVFGELRGARAVNMWRMLVAGGRDLDVSVSDVHASGNDASARWVATYTFPSTGRRVRNVVTARFTFRDGLIARHEDAFDLWKWSRMALGPVGTLLGWTPLVQRRIRRDALRGLDRFATREQARAAA